MTTQTQQTLNIFHYIFEQLYFLIYSFHYEVNSKPGESRMFKIQYTGKNLYQVKVKNSHHQNTIEQFSCLEMLFLIIDLQSPSNINIKSRRLFSIETFFCI